MIRRFFSWLFARDEPILWDPEIDPAEAVIVPLRSQRHLSREQMRAMRPGDGRAWWWLLAVDEGRFVRIELPRGDQPVAQRAGLRPGSYRLGVGHGNSGTRVDLEVFPGWMLVARSDCSSRR